MALLRHNLLEVLELPDVRALLRMADLPIANHTLPRYFLVFEEGGDVGYVFAEHLGIRVEDLLHSVQGWEEGAPEHVAAVFAIADAVDTAVVLHLHDLVDAVVFELGEVGAGFFVLLDGMTFVQEA